MRMACLCPTFRRRPALVENIIACFLNQTYPAELRRLIVLDDGGTLPPTAKDNWQIVVTQHRYPSLPAKYNALVRLARDAEALVVWEDDDFYLPWWLESVAKVLREHPWSHPKQVFTTYGGQLHLEPAAGRFHGALAIRREAWKEVGGWPETRRADFDQRLIGLLTARFGPAGDPCRFDLPGYCFRWQDSHDWHGQGFMQGPGDEDWYDRCAEQTSANRVGQIVPRWDPGTIRIYREIQMRRAEQADDAACDHAHQPA